MKKCLLAFVAASIAIISCKKNVSEPNTPPPPPVHDTTKPENVDTVYLRKTEKIYSYDETGALTDSTLRSWTYDGQRRVSTEAYLDFLGGPRDSVYYSYSSNQNLIETIYSPSGVFQADIKDSVFLNSSGKPDSLWSVDYFVGFGTPQYFYSVRYYYYDELGRDTLETLYNLLADKSRYVASQFRKTYKGNDVDSAIEYDGQGYISSKIAFLNGNQVSVDYFTTGVLSGRLDFTFFDILSGGFYGYTGDRQLQQTSAYTYINTPGTNVLYTYTYTFDKGNRVTTRTAKLNNIVRQISEYTYY